MKVRKPYKCFQMTIDNVLPWLFKSYDKTDDKAYTFYYLRLGKISFSIFISKVII